MIMALVVIYLWAGMGFSKVLIMMRTLVPIANRSTSLQIAFSSILFWPVICFVFMFYDVEKKVIKYNDGD